MTIDVYFFTDIRTIKQKEGTFYAALSAETSKGEVWIPHKGKVTANGNGASIRALHDIIAGDEHHIDPYKGSRIIIHSTSPYVTTSHYLLKKCKSDGWKTSKGADIAHKELWQEINCNLAGNDFEVVDEKPDSEAIKKLLETA